MKALGIDVASARWRDNGAAVIDFESARFVSVRAGALAWPSGEPLTPRALAARIDAFARREGIGAVALDGPLGWRDPETPEGTPGVGRRSEFACRTQGKTGVRPRTYPGTQRRWFEFCVELFDELLARGGVALANSPAPARPAAYLVLECFPTSTWRAAGLAPLPGKAKRPRLGPYVRRLRAAFGLPPFAPEGHDELQAVVAALSAVGVLGGPALARAHGVAARTATSASGEPVRVEGFIWDAAPRP